VAWLLDTTNGTPSRGFSVVATEFALGNYTFVHEIGHNQGANHARGDGFGGAPAWGGIFEDSNGYRFEGASGTLHRTVMAYSPGSRIGRFSNPDRNFDGEPTGIGPASDPESADNARTLNITIPVVEKYLEAPKVEVEPKSYLAPRDGGTVEVTVTSNGDWTATCDEDWVVITAGSGNGDGSFQVEVLANTSRLERSAIVEVKRGLIVAEFLINQEASVPPNVPVLINPSSLATGVDRTVTLRTGVFQDGDGDTHVATQWQIDNNPRFTSPEFDEEESSGDLTSIEVPDGVLGYRTQYYWRVRFKDSNDSWSDWSSTWRFTTETLPSRPGLVSPFDEAAGVSVTATLRASSFSDPDGHGHGATQWQIDDAVHFATLVWDELDSDVDKTSEEIPSGTLNYGQTYYWRVRYEDTNGGWSPWSETFSFSTSSQPTSPPIAPTLVSPAGNATGLGLMPTLVTSAFSDPDDDGHAATEWQVDDDSTFGSPEWQSIDDDQDKTSQTIPAGRLSHGTTYFWRARHQDSRWSWGAWSAAISFTTEIPITFAPAKPVLVSPKDGTIRTSATPLLEAGPFSDADAHAHAESEWQVDDDPAFANPEWVQVDGSGDKTTELVSPNTLSFNRSYFWRVRYKDSSGAWSDWSEPWSFTTDVAESLKITASEIDPAEETFVLSWDSREGREYRVQKSTDLRNWIGMNELYVGTGEIMTVHLGMNATLSGQFFRVIDSEDVVVESSLLLEVPSGSFQMGDAFAEADIDERPVHTVEVSSFFVQATEVTHAQMADVLNWAENAGLVTVAGSTVSNVEGASQILLQMNHPNAHLSWDGAEFVVAAGFEEHPVVGVSWYGAVAYCDFRTRMEANGLTRCYDLSDWSCDFEATGYRLPTEAEWEMAARMAASNAGKTWRYPFGNQIDPSKANYTRAEDATIAVGSYPGIAGLGDMAGNVWEWCHDRYSATYYSRSAAKDPVGPETGSTRVLRGGSWNSAANDCRVTDRFFREPTSEGDAIGFRPVRR
jgi:formylglycine-generating enzyme required for sulfatase activity